MGGNVANGSPIGDSRAGADGARRARSCCAAASARARMPLTDFYLDYMKNRLEPGEFVQALEVPRRAAGAAGARLQDQQALRLRHLGGLRRRWRSSSTATSSRACALAFGGMAATVRRAAAPRPRCSASRGRRPRVQRREAALARRLQAAHRHARQRRLPHAGGAEPAAAASGSRRAPSAAAPQHQRLERDAARRRATAAAPSDVARRPA